MRVRLDRIDLEDLRIFDFDYDVTMMILFLSPDERVYSRYGGRVAEGADSRHSLAGLRYTMESVLREHRSSRPRYAPYRYDSPTYVRRVRPGERAPGCLHCHQIKQLQDARLIREGRWTPEKIFRYPPPEQIGLHLDVDRGNVVARVDDGSPAARAGLEAGDILEYLNAVPIHSFGDAQYALDLAPWEGEIPASWWRGGERYEATIALPPGWRRTDIAWRASMFRFLTLPRLSGPELSAADKAALGLPADRLAFRQEAPVSQQAAKAGIRPGDVIIGINDQDLRMTLDEFRRYVQSYFVTGETIVVNVIREGKRLRLPMVLE